MLDLAVAFGLERLRTEWAELEAEGGPEACRAASKVARILRNIEEGFRRADSGNYCPGTINVNGQTYACKNVSTPTSDASTMLCQNT
jgi:hypothetical protein